MMRAKRQLPKAKSENFSLKRQALQARRR